MARPTDFVDPDYDKRLAEFKARRAEMKKQMSEQKPAKAEAVRNSATNNNQIKRY